MTSVQSDMDVSVRSSSADAARRIEELGRIIMAYSEVTERLQESHERLQQTVAALREELGEKNRQLERRNRLAALGEMAAGLAHEIRNPLGGIHLYASLLDKDLEDRPQSREVVGKISRGVRRLEALVGQVLAFSREIKASRVRMDLREMIEQAVELAGASLEMHGARCVIDGPRELVALADPLLMGQALLNLLVNAAEAAGRDGVVTVQLRAAEGDDSGRFYVAVRDSGPGIDAESMDRIFNPFYTTRDTGTGLGLAIVHRIVEAHDGTIRARNGESGGAVFEITV